MGKSRRLPIDFSSQCYEDTSARSFSAQKLVNWYAEEAKVSEKAPKGYLLRPVEGLTTLLTQGTDAWRGFTSMGGVKYGVVGASLVSVIDGVATVLGTLNTTLGPVSMAASSDTLIIVDGFFGYGYSEAGGFQQITDEDFQPARWVTYQDGYFIFGENNDEGVWFMSNLLDGFNYDALDFASAEAAPDSLVMGISNHRELWLFGSRSVEVWWNTGNADFAFERINGAFIERGCGAPESVTRLDNQVYWVGDNAVIYRAGRDYDPQRISTHAIERLISGMDDFSDAYGMTYTYNGHQFYLLTFPSIDRTFVFDASTGLWHERGDWDSAAGRFKRYPAAVMYQDGSTIYAGDWDTGALYTVDGASNYYGSALIRYMMAFPPLATGQDETISILRLLIDFQAGQGVTVGQGIDPQAMLRWSNDGGFTWSNEHWADMGRKGEYGLFTSWRRLGRVQKGRVFECSVSDPVRPTVMGAYVDLWVADDFQ